MGHFTIMLLLIWHLDGIFTVLYRIRVRYNPINTIDTIYNNNPKPQYRHIAEQVVVGFQTFCNFGRLIG